MPPMTATRRKCEPLCNYSASPDSCTSNCSVQSSCGSNNYEQCVNMYNAQETLEKLHWTPTMDFNFISTYVDWKKTKHWDNHKSNDQNFDRLAAYLRDQCSMQVTGGQCQSRLYRFKKKWYAFSSLRGLSSKPETGVGWDEENNCFVASMEHWNQMEASNTDYKDFKKPGSCYLYDIYSEIALGSCATGSYAQSASHPVLHDAPQQQPGASTSRKNKGKAPASASVPPAYSNYPWEGEDVYYVPPVPGAPPTKRPASSLGTSGDRDGFRSEKRSRSSNDREKLDDALSKFSRLSTVSIESKQCKQEHKVKYGIEVVQDIIRSMNLSQSVKLKTTMYFADSRNELERIAFVRFDEADRYVYIDEVMEELRGAKDSK